MITRTRLSLGVRCLSQPSHNTSRPHQSSLLLIVLLAPCPRQLLRPSAGASRPRQLALIVLSAPCFQQLLHPSAGASRPRQLALGRSFGALFLTASAPFSRSVSSSTAGSSWRTAPGSLCALQLETFPSTAGSSTIVSCSLPSPGTSWSSSPSPPPGHGPARGPAWAIIRVAGVLQGGLVR